MTRERNIDKLVQHWLERAEDSLASARSEIAPKVWQVHDMN